MYKNKNYKFIITRRSIRLVHTNETSNVFLSVGHQIDIVEFLNGSEGN